MPIKLSELLNPATTAVLCMEMQRGVVGDLSPMPQLADAVNAVGVKQNLASLLDAARSSGVQVVFCNALHRKDRKGSGINAPMLARSAKQGGEHLVEGSASADNIPELNRQPGDFVAGRYHGMSPFTGTSLDAALRNMGIKSIVATGVSLNVGVFAMVCEAVGLGYSVVVPRDCVAGLPADYAQAVLTHSLPVVAAVVTSGDIKAAWR
jgi:nicotinamidase-related amidase